MPTITPVPWEAVGHIIRTAMPEGFEVASCPLTNPNRLADATLMAAAPELKTSALDLLHGVYHLIHRYPGVHHILEPQMKALHAAIVKSGGK
jgi:hypothetical protein